MNMHRSVRLSLATAVAPALFGMTSVAAAQTLPQQQAPPPPTTTALPAVQPQTPPTPATPMPAQPQTPPAPTMPSQQQMPPTPPAQPSPEPPSRPPATQPPDTSVQFYPGTKSSASYPIQNGTLTVNAGMPKQVQSYGPPPSFKSLDANHDGRISDTEAQAYPPLDSDFLYASGGGQSINHGQYEKWVRNQH